MLNSHNQRPRQFPICPIPLSSAPVLRNPVRVPVNPDSATLSVADPLYVRAGSLSALALQTGDQL